MNAEPSGSANAEAPVPAPLRKTRQRAAVRSHFEHTRDFQTAIQVYDGLRTEGNKIGLTTVYRTLQAMAEANELDMLRTADGEASYRYCSTGHHHHLVCRQCNRAVELTGPTVERWAQRMAEEHGFVDVQHHIEVSGLCGACAAARRDG